MPIVEHGGQKFMVDSLGRLVPIENVSALDKLRTEFVEQTAAKAREMQAALTAFKLATLDDIHTLIELAAEQYNAKIGGELGNVTLVSFDGKTKILIQIQKSIEFGEQIHAAKALIDECLSEWTVDSRPEIRAIIGDAFRTDSNNELNTARVLSLRRLSIDDPRWINAMKALADSITAKVSKSYLRIYQREDSKSDWRQIPLDVSAT